VRNSEEYKLVQLQPNLNAVPASLRYFDPEVQNAANAEPLDMDRFIRANAKGQQLKAAYLEALTALAPRLSKRTFSLFADPREPLFDSDLAAFSAGDLLPFATSGTRRMRMELNVQATFRSFDLKTLHQLRYRGIKSLNFNFPAERWFDWGDSVASLLAHELTGEQTGPMQHAFYFVSGATLSITFERVSWQAKRNSQA
jgi:hypothetical protein